MDLIPLDNDDLPLMRVDVMGSTPLLISADPGNAIEQRNDGLFVSVGLTAAEVQAMIAAAIDEALGSQPAHGISMINSDTIITAQTIIQGSA